MAYIQGLRLAHLISEDDTFEISVLIGADYYWDFVEDEVIRGNGPTPVKSKLGYLLSGPIRSRKTNSNDSVSSNILNILVSHKSEEFDLQKFWNLESLGIDTPSKDEKEISYLQQYQESSIEFRENRYYAKLPWKQECDELPTNYNITIRRTENVIRRLSKDPGMLKKYGEILQEQERRGFIEKVTVETNSTDNRIHYIPHHPVFKKDSNTTPVRIVYDCS